MADNEDEDENGGQCKAQDNSGGERVGIAVIRYFVGC